MTITCFHSVASDTLRAFVVVIGIMFSLTLTGTASANKYGTITIYGNKVLDDHQFGAVIFGADDIELDCDHHQVHISSHSQVNCGSGKCAIVANGRSNISIRNCDIVGGFQHGIWLNGVSVATINSTNVYGTTADAVRIEGSSNVVGSSLNALYNTAGFAFRDSWGMFFGSCSASYNILDGFDDGSNGATCNNGTHVLEYDDCEAIENGVNGFESDCLADTTIFYPGCVAQDNGQHGFSFDRGLNHVVTGAQAIGNEGDGFRFQDVSNAWISGNTATGQTCDAYQEDSTGMSWDSNTLGNICGDVPIVH